MTDLPMTMALARGLHLAATVSLLGSAGFVLFIMPAAGADVLRGRLAWLQFISGLVAVVAGVVWFTLQSAAIAGAATLPDLYDAVPVVALHTRYGRVLLARLGLLVVATLLAYPRAWGGWVRAALILLLSAIAVSLQGLIGHAGATEGAVGDGLVLSEALHLLGAGLWLGALLPLGLSLFALPAAQAALVCERFTPIGLGCVVVLGGTGFAQGVELIGGVAALFGTAYGHFALLKIGLFVVALVLAALNRLWLADRLALGAGSARRHLVVSVGVETLVGLAIVGAAAFMASSPPAAHVAPVWPFPWRLSLVAVREDAALRWEVVVSLVLIAGALALLVAALAWRRLRLAAVAVLAALVVVRGPSLRLLTVEAFPTSFQRSPTGFSAASIVRGQALYGPNCASCHGAGGVGDGPAAAGLRIRPADLTMPHLWEHSDGEMVWWLGHGIDDPEGGVAMPGFGAALPAEDLWALIDYVRAHNAGAALQQDTALQVPVRAPGFAVACDGVDAASMADLRGRAVHVVTDGSGRDWAPVPPQAGVPIVTLSLRGVAAAGGCEAADPAAWGAYAVLAGGAPGAEFLVDQNGWLRAAAAGGWGSRGALIAAMLGICTNPVPSSSGGEHEHHH
jgi:putative copper export protein/mono/diheme cytochrome c family protein